jgi:molybdopterin-guanine dinucleotide biosynthesis protein A
MRILGAILAGGKAQRFGSDKAHALYRGERLIDRVTNALKAQCDAVVVCGREEPGFTCIPDLPGPDMGPLGGLNAALHYAHGNGFDLVLAAPCDIPDLPHDLVHKLVGAGAALVASQPVVGLWPTALVADLVRFMQGERLAVMAFADAVGARRVEIHPPLSNVNRPEDLPGD